VERLGWLKVLWSADRPDQVGADDAYLVQIRAAETRSVEAKLLQIGVSASLETRCFTNLTCEAFKEAQALRRDLPALTNIDSSLAAIRPWIDSADLLDSVFANQLQAAEGQDEATLVVLAARDQAFRTLLLSLLTGALETGLDEANSRLLVASTRLRVVKNDIDAANRLKAIIAARTWPMQPRVGSAAQSAAWLIVQHADRDPALQIETLQMLEKPEHQERFRRDQYALLYDRVQLAIGRDQRFGTQIACENGTAKATNLEQPDDVDARRAAQGLGPLQTYIARVGLNCESEQ